MNHIKLLYDSIEIHNVNIIVDFSKIVLNKVMFS